MYSMGSSICRAPGRPFAGTGSFAHRGLERPRPARSSSFRRTADAMHGFGRAIGGIEQLVDEMRVQVADGSAALKRVFKGQVRAFLAGLPRERRGSRWESASSHGGRKVVGSMRKAGRSSCERGQAAAVGRSAHTGALPNARSCCRG